MDKKIIIDVDTFHKILQDSCETILYQISVNNTNLRCSFCYKNQVSVKRLIAGPGVYICDECVALCAEIVSIKEKEESDLTTDKQVITMEPIDK